MKYTYVHTAEASSHSEADAAIQDFIRRRPNIEITHLSSAMAWNVDTDAMLYCITILFKEDA